MILDYTKRHKFSMDLLATKAGYRLHNNKKDYIKEDEHGRFHIKHIEKRIFDLHYDINIEWRHLSIDMPIRCGKEKKRLRKLSYCYFPADETVSIKEKKQPQTYADILNKKQQQTIKINKKPKVKSVSKKKKYVEYADPLVVKEELERIKKEREFNKSYPQFLLNYFKNWCKI